MRQKKSRKLRKSRKQRKQRKQNGGGFAYSPQPGALVGFTRKAGVDSIPTVSEFRNMLPEDERA